ncbi:MAG: synthase subunit [Bacillales bacterium]|jgi:F-type H+-transporting ATPase subunit b|nr:synthase subunit [Bacillales bacterium]
MLNANLLVLGASAGASAVPYGTIIFQLLIFLVLLALLRKYAFGPLMNVMKEREQHINSQLDSAEKQNNESKELVNKLREDQKAARVESATLLENARKQAETQKEEIITAARNEADSLKNAAVLEIQREKALAVQALQEQMASISIQIASKILEKEIDEADNANLVKGYLSEIQKVGEAK